MRAMPQNSPTAGIFYVPAKSKEYARWLARIRNSFMSGLEVCFLRSIELKYKYDTEFAGFN